MSAVHVEALLARLYTDDALLRRFKADATAVGREAGLDADEAAMFARIDMHGLEAAAASYAKKRAGHVHRKGPLARLAGYFASLASKTPR